MVKWCHFPTIPGGEGLPEMKALRKQFFNPNVKRDEKVVQHLMELEPYRKGIAKVIFNHEHVDVVAMKNCPICKSPAPLTQSAQFCCRDCMVLFQ